MKFISKKSGKVYSGFETKFMNFFPTNDPLLTEVLVIVTFENLYFTKMLNLVDIKE